MNLIGTGIASSAAIKTALNNWFAVPRNRSIPKAFNRACQHKEAHETDSA